LHFVSTLFPLFLISIIVPWTAIFSFQIISANSVKMWDKFHFTELHSTCSEAVVYNAEKLLL
jgi:nucleoside recognition membrane protein YjiH